MKNMYFEGNLHGLEMIADLEYWCILQQRMKFCIKHNKPIFAISDYALMDDYGFKSKDTNPKGCEGMRENRVYYSWKGSVHYTQNKFKKFLIKIFFEEMKYKEETK